MPLTKIEQFVFGGNSRHLLRALTSKSGAISITVTALDSKTEARMTTAVFSDAAITGVWRDPEEVPEWPLEIIGFDSYPSGKRWKFVLNCDVIEWSWESEWPTLM
jgi:hypothetical protein